MDAQDMQRAVAAGAAHDPISADVQREPSDDTRDDAAAQALFAGLRITRLEHQLAITDIDSIGVALKRRCVSLPEAVSLAEPYIWPCDDDADHFTAQFQEQVETKAAEHQRRRKYRRRAA